MGVALWLALRARGEERGDAFWTAGRDLGPGSVGLSISAGFLSISWSCVYAVQLFHWYGLGAVWLVTIPWLLALAGIYVLARRYNELPAFSQPEMVRARFGGAAAKLVAGALAFVFLVWGGAEIHVAGGLLAPGMGISQESVVLLIGLGVGAYATLGGFRAVIDTDKVQYAVVVLYIGAVAWLALRGLSSLEGGIGAVFADPPEASRTGRPWTSLLGPGIATIVLTLVAYLPGWLFETDLWLRVQAARSPRAARRGVLIAGINGALFVGALPLLIGVAALALFPASADGTLSPAVGEEGEAIFTALVAHYGPGWLAVPVAVGLLAAAMSTIDTCVNVVALSVAYDFGGAGSMPEERAARFLALDHGGIGPGRDGVRARDRLALGRVLSRFRCAHRRGGLPGGSRAVALGEAAGGLDFDQRRTRHAPGGVRGRELGSPRCARADLAHRDRSRLRAVGGRRCVSGRRDRAAVEAKAATMIRIELEDGQPRYCYHVAGQDLVSDREIEALAAFAASDEPLPTEPADPEPATPLTEAPILFAGRAWVGGATRWVECRSADGAYRLTIAGEPILRIEPSGVIRRGQGRPGQGEPSEELLVGPALILALASRGVFCLHASAVQVGGGVLLLPGDSGRGKSTLAATWSSAEGKSIRLGGRRGGLAGG